MRDLKAVFISDFHLGTRDCQAEALLSFLKFHEADEWWLVGDIVDGWRLKSSWFWPQSHNDVIQKLLRKARKGSRVVFIPGNHDEFARDYAGSEFGGIEVLEESVRETADGRRMLILHGDKFDVVVRNAKWLAHLGDWAYDMALLINRWVAFCRRKLGLPYWSFSAFAKGKVKSAVNFVGAFEDAVAADAAKAGASIVVCGHIHQAAIRPMNGVLYVNCGDWVESRTAILEHRDGTLELVRWDAGAATETEAPAVQTEPAPA